jgi:hypothetical protein
MANFWRVLEFDKFAGEWPLLIKKAKYLPKSHNRENRLLFKKLLTLGCLRFFFKGCKSFNKIVSNIMLFNILKIST